MKTEALSNAIKSCHADTKMVTVAKSINPALVSKRNIENTKCDGLITNISTTKTETDLNNLPSTVEDVYVNVLYD